MNLVFQVSIKPNKVKTSGRKKFTYSKELYDYSNLKARKYAKKYNADYFCLRSDEWLGKEYSPAYHKLYIYELFKEGYDKIFYIDSDAIVREDCPNIFEYNEFSACKDLSDTPSGIEKQRIKNEKLNLSKDYNCFCSATVLFDREFYERTKDHWREELKNPQPQHDQSLFNILVDKYYGNYNILDNEWGHWRKKNGKFISHVPTSSGTKTFDESKY